MSTTDELILEARKKELYAEIDEALAPHRAAPQRSQEWYGLMARTVGGSEIAALLGEGGRSMRSIALDKWRERCGARRSFESVACAWGVVFEDVAAACVAVDLGAPVVGDEVCIQLYDGHRTSPDGYVVARFRGPRLCCRTPGNLEISHGMSPAQYDREVAETCYEDDGEMSYGPSAASTSAASTSAAPTSETQPPRGLSCGSNVADSNAQLQDRLSVLLVEIKCPLSRVPDGVVPRQYVPQLWSGLAVSPFAERGLFVDCMFRLCSVEQLLRGGIAWPFHARGADRADPPEGTPGPPAIAWGLIGVYAPEHGEACERAARDYGEYFGLSPAVSSGPIDYGDASLGGQGGLANRALLGAARGAYTLRRLAPCFADGRGAPLRTAADIGRALCALDDAPPGTWLLGVIPWKLCAHRYSLVERRADFVETVLPRVRELHELVDAMVAAGAGAEALLNERFPVRRPKKTADSDLIEMLAD